MMEIKLEDKPKRLLIVYNPQFFERQLIVSLGDMLMRNSFHVWSMPTYDCDAPDIRIFDLDGAPAPDTGLIQQLLASIVDKAAGASADAECSGVIDIAESEIRQKGPPPWKNPKLPKSVV